MSIGKVCLDSAKIPEFGFHSKKPVRIIGRGMIVRSKGCRPMMSINVLGKSSGQSLVIPMEAAAEIEADSVVQIINQFPSDILGS